MYARVTTFPGLAPERVKATLEEFREQHLPLLERSRATAGCGRASTLPVGERLPSPTGSRWRTCRATDKLAADVRAAAVSASGLDRNRPPVIDRYEMVIQKQPAHV
jgi:hypothetical protein